MPFDYEEYEAKCSQMTVEQLHKEWENYTRQISGGATGTAISSVAAPFTGGISIIGVGMSAPRIHNARKKREIIERFLQAQGTTHKTRKRDVLAPMAISGILGTMTLGMAAPAADMVMEAGTAHGIEVLVASKIGTEVATHVVLEAGGQAAEHAHTQHDKKKGARKLVEQQWQEAPTDFDSDVIPQYETSIYSTQSLDEKRRHGQKPSKYSESHGPLSPQRFPTEQKYEPQSTPPPYSSHATPQSPYSLHPESSSSSRASPITPSHPAPSYDSQPSLPENNDLQSPPRLPLRPSATPLQHPTEVDADSEPHLLPPSAMPGALPHSYSAPIYTPVALPHVYESRPQRYQLSTVEAMTQSFTALSHETQLPASEVPTPTSASSSSMLSPQSQGAMSYSNQSSEHNPRLPPRPTSQAGDNRHTQQQPHKSKYHSRPHTPQPPPLQLYIHSNGPIQQPLSQTQSPQTPQTQLPIPPPPHPQQPTHFPPPPNSPPPVYPALQPYNPQDYAHSNVPQGPPIQQGYGERIGGLPYNQPAAPNVQQHGR